MLCVAAPSRGSRPQNPVYAARNRLANLRAIFHIKSDSATFDNIAVPSGNRSSDRVLAACGIGPFSSGWRTTKSTVPLVNIAQEICQARVVMKTPWFSARSERPAKFSDGSFERAGRLHPPIWPSCQIRKRAVNRRPPYQQICNEYVIRSRIFFIFAARYTVGHCSTDHGEII